MLVLAAIGLAFVLGSLAAPGRRLPAFAAGWIRLPFMPPHRSVDWVLARAGTEA